MAGERNRLILEQHCRAARNSTSAAAAALMRFDISARPDRDDHPRVTAV